MSAEVVVVGLRAGRRRDGGAVATATPPLSWMTETDRPDWMQAAAEVEKDGIVHRVEGDASLLVAWPYDPLAPREECRVRVRVEGEDGSRSDWSGPLVILAGHLLDGEWRARMIGLAEPSEVAQPVLLRRDFVVDAPVRRAVLYSTANGVYDARLNDRAVDDAEMKPGWTAYQHRLLYDVVDVTTSLRDGTNTLAVELAGGWYTEEYGFGGHARRFYGDQPAFAGQLAIEYESGRTKLLATDETWFATADGPRTRSGIYQGESVDARREAPSDLAAWSRVVVREGLTVPQPRSSEPVRAIEERAVESVIETPTGKTVVDFGQNLVGRLRIRVSGAAGTVVTLRHAEVLEDGELGTRPLRLAAATDTYTLRGGEEETWEPRFTFHGFRYAQIDGWPGVFDPAAVTAVVMHSDLTRTGWLETSHPLLNRLHENVLWGTRGNFFSIPTDCPQRDERLGWTGDIQVFAPTASFLFDCDAFLASWLEDLAADQRAAGGIVPFVVPNVLPWRPTAAAAWGDAATVVPVVLWERFGDTDAVRAQYPSMKAWVDTIGQLAGPDLLWEGRFQFGDWLDPDAPPDDPARAKVDPGIVATAYLYRSTRLVTDAARVLDESCDAEEYAGRAERIRGAFRSAYITPTGRLLSDAPTAYALALQFDLAPPQLRQAMGDRLALLVRSAGYRMSTGFVGTPLIQDALVATGHLVTAGRLLRQTENPSWLYAVTMGATTIWERWDSMLEDGSINPGWMTSFNHYAFGAVADWMHRSLGGIAPAAPGYHRSTIAPRPIDGVEWATASHTTPYGRVSVHWSLHHGSFELDVTVPPNTSADVRLPDGIRHEVRAGRHRFTAEIAAAGGAPAAATLDSTLAEIIDDEGAYDVVRDALSRVDPDEEWMGRRTHWVPERSLRDELLMSPGVVVDEIGSALMALGRERRYGGPPPAPPSQ